MSDSVSVIIRTADGTRKADVTVPKTLTVGQMLSATQEKWNLPSNTGYAMKLEGTGEQLDPNSTLASAGVMDNDVLSVLPNLEAG